jgi:7-cyano-7-deazaguanine synthase in queuosine biosynthesis
MGTHKTDTLNNFPDCNPSIAQKVQDLLNCSTSRTDWVIDTPFINMTKDEIAATLADTKYELLRAFVFSGYGDALEY